MNILSLPKTGFAQSTHDIAEHLREQADRIENEAEALRNVYLIFEREDGSVYRQTMGQTCDLARAIGVITIACIRGAMGEE